MATQVVNLDNFNNNFNLDINLEYKNVDDNEKNNLYRKCFLEFLKLDNYHDNLVTKKMNLLYETTNHIEELNKKYTEESGKILSTLPELGVVIMLSYDELDNYIKLLKSYFK